MIDPTIFHDYDIRGIYPTELNEDVYYVLGRAIAEYLKVDTIAAGRDMRVSSPQLFAALVDGITDQGVNVVDLGLISTEMHYFASGKYGFPANVIVSASHNPAEYNGIKIVTKGVVALHGDKGLPEIKALALADQFSKAPTKGQVTQKDVFAAWIDHALSFVDVDSIRLLKVVVDAGNGMGGPAWLEVAKRLPITLVPLYLEPDGTFPHHPPDPINEKNLADLKSAVLREQADLGIAIDGDADRMFLIDEKAHMLSGTIITAILAESMLKQYGPQTILFNVIVGKVVPDVVRKHGGMPVRVRVGHSFIKEYMKQHKAIFAGEHSGHYYFRENFYADSSLIPGLLTLQILSKQNISLSQLVQSYSVYAQSGEINFTVPDRGQVIAQIKQEYHDAEIDEIDGVSFHFDDWWFNVRTSKTEPLLRLNVEANSPALLTQNVDELVAKLQALGGTRKV